MQYEISNRMSDVHGSAIRELFKLGADPNMISFGGGNPSAETFPVFRDCGHHRGRHEERTGLCSAVRSVRGLYAAARYDEGTTSPAHRVLISRTMSCSSCPAVSSAPT